MMGGFGIDRYINVVYQFLVFSSRVICRDRCFGSLATVIICRLGCPYSECVRAFCLSRLPLRTAI